MSSTTASPPDSDARDHFLALRRAANLPPGGEVVVKSEVIQVAEALDLDFDPGWTKPRIVFEMLYEHVYSHRDDYTWDDACKPKAARDYQYLQSREARALAESIES